MSVVRAAAALASLAVVHAAGAEVNTLVRWEASLDGSNWTSDELLVQPNDVVQVRALVSYIGTESPIGLALCHVQPTISGWHSTDVLLPFVNGGQGGNTSVPLGVVPADGPGYGRVSPWGRVDLNATTFIRGHEHTNGFRGAPPGSWLRIAQNSATAWVGAATNTTGGLSVPILQLNNVGRTTADPAFSSQLQDIVIFRMGLSLNGTTFGRHMLIDSPLEGVGSLREVYWYSSMDQQLSAAIRGSAVVDPVLIIPAPASLLAVGAGGLVVARRRRVGGLRL